MGDNFLAGCGYARDLVCPTLKLCFLLAGSLNIRLSHCKGANGRSPAIRDARLAIEIESVRALQLAFVSGIRFFVLYD